MKFVPNPEFEAKVAAAPLVKAAVRASAEHAAGKAEAFTKDIMRRKGHRQVEVVTHEGETAIANTNHGGAIEEYGSSKSPPYAPLRRGVRAAGLRIASTD